MTTSNSCVLGVPVLAGLIGHALAASEHTIDSARLANSTVRYPDQSQLSESPAPVVYFRAAGLARGPSEIAEIKGKILYPLIETSRKPISAVVVQWFSGQPTGPGVTVLRSDGEARESTVVRSAQGQYDARAHEILFAKPTP